MTDAELKHLIKMLNQISANLARGDSEEQDAARVADHVRRFWAPSMRAKIADYAALDEDALADLSKRAIAVLGDTHNLTT
ncbi:MAG: formate dehydrogenase subunit delta [Gammaproteobacteria bacterium]|jgi:formate dehydrogenase subunit delta|nr:formate dehydrogenase subunit delta [Gammaproteobacteria bacterium]MDP6652234.1 formate dehydrogenase subunit delta [Gammaproteobacteria bacterium]|tara:strand:- start:312 stop:551 length:240 start_codon:yes stop_codon:yes gene_type:complete